MGAYNLSEENIGKEHKWNCCSWAGETLLSRNRYSFYVEEFPRIWAKEKQNC